MTAGKVALELAEEQIAEAIREGYPVLNLSPLTINQWETSSAGSYPGDPRFADLDRIPASLAGAGDLQEIRFNGTKVTELGPLGSLIGLQRLHLDNTAVEDLSPLEACRSLEVLRFCDTRVSDLSPLAGLMQLSEILAHDTPVAELAPLAGLTALSTLGISRTGVSDLTPIREHVGIRSLHFGETTVSDLSPLIGLTELYSLSLNDTDVSDLAPIANSKEIQYLSLGGTNISDVAAVAAMPDLVDLDIRNTPVADLGFLSSTPGLRSLSFDGSQVRDISPLAKLEWLERIALNNTPVDDIAAIAGKHKLTELDLSETQVVDLGPVAKLEQLTRLKLDNAPVSNLSPIAELPQLAVLSLDGTRVKDLGPLSRLKPLQLVSFSRTPAVEADSRLAEIDAILDSFQKIEALRSWLRERYPSSDEPALGSPVDTNDAAVGDLAGLNETNFTDSRFVEAYGFTRDENEHVRRVLGTLSGENRAAFLTLYITRALQVVDNYSLNHHNHSDMEYLESLEPGIQERFWREQDSLTQAIINVFGPFDDDDIDTLLPLARLQHNPLNDFYRDYFGYFHQALVEQALLAIGTLKATRALMRPQESAGLECFPSQSGYRMSNQ